MLPAQFDIDDHLAAPWQIKTHQDCPLCENYRP